MVILVQLLQNEKQAKENLLTILVVYYFLENHIKQTIKK